MKKLFQQKTFRIKNILENLPTFINLSYNWNYGSLLGLCLAVQILTGLFLATYYTNDMNIAFYRVVYLIREVKIGWLIRAIHANVASIFFIFIYLHIRRRIYYGSFNNVNTWYSGSLIFILLIICAFFGYVIPWGQISLWAATVITSLISVIPYLGTDIIEWVWGGFSVNNLTLKRFYVLHFIIPFLLLLLITIHLITLHNFGSLNPLGIFSQSDKISFHPRYTYKDFAGFIIFLLLITNFFLFFPSYLRDPENFILANFLVTPEHIQPEWYFLFAYAILRSIPRKLGGVIAFVSSVLIICFMPINLKRKFYRFRFYIPSQIIFWLFIINFLLLTWIGRCPIEQPFIKIRQIFTFIYFIYFLIYPLLQKFWDFILFRTANNYDLTNN